MQRRCCSSIAAETEDVVENGRAKLLRKAPIGSSRNDVSGM
jgi:hypothetical protein